MPEAMWTIGAARQPAAPWWAARGRLVIHAFSTAGHAPALEVPDEWLLVVTTFLRGEELRRDA